MFINLLEARLFIYLVLLLMCCTSCRSLQTTGSETSISNSVLLFQEEKTNSLKPKIGKKEEECVTIKNIKSYFFLVAKELIVSLVNTRDDENGKCAAGYLLAKYIYTKQSNFVEEVLKTKNSETKWKTELITKNNPTDTKCFEAITSAVNVKENKIYVFIVNGTEKEDNDQCISYEKMENTLVVGTVNTNTLLSSADETITWETKQLSGLSDVLKTNDSFKEKYPNPLICDVFSFMTTESQFLLVLKGKTEKGDQNKNVIALVKAKESENKIELMHVDAIEGCNPHLFSWDNKIFMVTTDCKGSGGGNVKVREFTEKEKWVDSTGHFSCLGDLLKDKRDFTPTTIGSNVLLFTEQQNDEKAGTESGKKYKYYLFISDGIRVKKIGVVAKDVESVEPIRLLFTEGELFTLHQKLNSGDDKSLFLTRQQSLLAAIKEIISAWSNADNIIKKPCTSPSEISTLCVKELPKDGVVSFLSNNASGDNKEDWHDEYHYVNATVHEGVQVSNGFRFDKAGAKAVWLIGKPKDDMPYNFVNFGFTMVATITFEESTNIKQKRSVMGVTTGLNGNDVGVFCLEEIFAVNSNIKLSASETKNKKCVVEKQYQMALVYNDNNVCVYIDWEPLSDGHNFKIEKDSENDLQIYFGAHSKDAQISAAHMTVTNVLLYNRPFTADEIKKLKENNKNENAPSLPTNGDRNIYPNSGDNNSSPETSGINADETSNPEDTLITQTNSKENESLRSENSVLIFNIYVNVITLSLLFVSVFTFAGHYM